MMKYILTGLLLLHFCRFCNAQKKLITHDTYRSWPKIEAPAISNDGKFLLYWLTSPAAGSTQIIQSTDKNWKREYKGVEVGTGHFTENSDMVVFFRTDTMSILELKNEKLFSVNNVIEYKQPADIDNTWLAYRKSDLPNILILHNLVNNKERQLNAVTNYKFSDNGKTLLYVTKEEQQDLDINKVNLINLSSGKVQCIYKGSQTANWVFDSSGRQCAFLIRKKNGLIEDIKLGYFKDGMDTVKIMASRYDKNQATKILSNENISFSSNGNKIFVQLRSVDTMSLIPAYPNPHNVEIWRYKTNVKIQKTSYTAVINLNTKPEIICLEEDSDKYLTFDLPNNSEYLITTTIPAHVRKIGGRLPDTLNYSIVNTTTGKRSLIKNNLWGYVQFSSSGKYLIWFDRSLKKWYTYEIRTGVIAHIGNELTITSKNGSEYSSGPICWLENDKAVLLYGHDRTEVWKIDPQGKNDGINLTEGIRSDRLLKFGDLTFNKKKPLKTTDKLILTVFNDKTKSSGFYELSIKNQKNTKLPYLNDCLYFDDDINLGPISARQIMPLKAKYSKTFVVTRMNSYEFPNLFITNDFRIFHAQTKLSPQKDYNWYHSELYRWSSENGQENEGIIFKPDGFDSTKKYPIIFYYYQKSANALNAFIDPELSNGVINIPWFVSNGYLVFVPDISTRVGQPGKSALNTVVSAAESLSGLPWVDKNKMGLQGASFGGFETNYIITHSTLFKVAVSEAAPSNLTSLYNFKGENPEGAEQYFFQNGQGAMHSTLWADNRLYIENSPVFKANEVTTPLLLVHNRGDGSVPFSQSGEFYSALKYLGKPVWLLIYANEGHTIDKEENQLDFSIRMGQFFDHYLKGKPAPLWMTNAQFGYELNPVNKP